MRPRGAKCDPSGSNTKGMKSQQGFASMRDRHSCRWLPLALGADPDYDEVHLSLLAAEVIHEGQ